VRSLLFIRIIQKLISDMADTEAYEELKKLVKNGDLSITYIDAPPRTASSPFYASLANVHDVGLYEPLLEHSGKEFTYILEKFEEAKEKDAGKKPVKIVIKEIAKHVSSDNLEKIMSLADNFFVVMRDPHLQLESLVRRWANDLAFGTKVADHLSKEEVWERAEQVEQLLKNGGMRVARESRGDFLKPVGEV